MMLSLKIYDLQASVLCELPLPQITLRLLEKIGLVAFVSNCFHIWQGEKKKKTTL